jgi:hypothetical protein
MTAEISGALDRIGRTEDVVWSSDGHRVVVVAFHGDRLAVLEVDDGDGGLEVKGVAEVRCSAFAMPHGVAFADADHVVVANRTGCAVIVRLPDPADGVHTVDVEVLHSIGDDGGDGVSTPGSVTVLPVADGLVEILLCNNFTHRVTRHLVDLPGRRTLESDVVVSTGLRIPDGIAVSRDRRWMAVSSHDDHAVRMYDASALGDLGDDTAAVGSLENVLYPHGVRFTPDGRWVVVADAGTPYVHVFESDTGEWSGTRQPVATVRVLDEETYLRGRLNPEEGGTKGIAIDPSGRVLLLTCEERPMWCVPLCALGIGPTDAVPDGLPPAADGARIRDVVLRAHRRIDAVARDVDASTAALESAEQHRTELERDRDAACVERDAAVAAAEGERRRAEYADSVVADRDAQLAGLRDSTSWRVTAPLRRLSGVAGRLRRPGRRHG